MSYDVFLSFTMEDKDLVELFRGQVKNRRPDLNLRDYSIKEPFETLWKTKCEQIIRMCLSTICLIGRNTYKSEAVDWELRKSVELGKAIMGVYLESSNVSLPKVLSGLGVHAAPWQMDKIVKELDRVAR